MKIWITGIAGFLGSHLAETLLQAGYKVGGNDNLLCGDIDNIPKEVKYNGTDCCDFGGMKRNFEKFKPDVVVHCAATAHEGLSSFSPSFITRNIYEASIATFSAAISAGVKRIVYMSSMARYGAGDPPFREDMIPKPVDPYGIAKVAVEDTLKILCQTHGLKWSIAVPHNIIGIRQRYVDPFRNVAAILINRCKQGKNPIIYGDGMQMRCFSPIKDCLPSLVKMVEGATDGEIVNIGPDGGQITINELAYHIKRITGFSGGDSHFPDRPNEVKLAYTSSDKARKLLDYKQQDFLIDCLKDMNEAQEPRSFIYDFPIEINKGCPEVWTERLM